jgi:predicted RNA-binding Zn-ribbon protein involved in translation (DUF1610 family)
MSQNVRVQCPTCRTWIVVMPPHVFEAVGDLWGIEGELGFREKIAGDTAQTGDRLAVADMDGRYDCPKCGNPGRLPPMDELFVD